MASDFLDDLPDEELAQRIGSGDLAAFDVLYLRYWNQVYYQIKGIVDRPEDARDITQDTLWKAYQHLPTLQLKSSFRSWIFTVAKHTAIDHLRKQKRELPRELDGSEVVEPSPEDAFIWSEAIKEEIEKLNPRERDICYLQDKGYTDEEIAERLQLSPRSVGTYRSTVRRKLRQIFPKKKIQSKRSGKLHIWIIRTNPEIC